MFKKLLNGESKSITSAAVIIGVAGLASRLLGVLRDRIIAGEFGAGQVTDIYYAAFRVPDMIYNFLILGALSAGFIPVFIKYLKSSEDDEWELASGVLNVIVICLVALGGIFFIFAPWIINWLSPGFTPAARETTVWMTRIMLLSPLFLGISAIFGGILQSLKKFFVYSFAPIFYNIGIMIGALVFVRWWGIYGLAWGVVLGAFLHMMVQIPPVIASGFKYKSLVSWTHPGIKRIVKLTIPRTLGLVVSQINLFVITVIASTLAAGSISVFMWANNLQGFLLGIFAVSFAIAAFPTLSAAMVMGDRKKFVSVFSDTARQILFFMIPLSITFLVLRAQIVRVAYGAGRFDWAATILTADTLAIFCLSLFAQALIQLLARAFYARHDTWTPFIIGLFSAAANLFLALYLSAHPFDFLNFHVGGSAALALAYSIDAIINASLLWVFLRIKVGSLEEGRILSSIFKISLATLGLGLTTQALKYLVEPFTGTETFLGIFSQGLIAGIGGLVVFVIISLVLKSEEMLTFIASIKRKFLKKEAVPEIDEGL